VLASLLMFSGSMGDADELETLSRILKRVER
jgi:hypothetical protein